jgi:UDP-N-acetylglucosamine acyltransferase
MAYAHIAHDCIIGNNVIMANSAGLAGHIVVEDWAIIGGMVAVHQFVHIGAHSMISGGSLVRKDVPPYTKAAREPLSYVGVNSIGLRRRGFTSETINQIQDIYRILYLKGYNVSKALRIIEADFPATPERDDILQFISNSSRGIMKGFTKRSTD